MSEQGKIDSNQVIESVYDRESNTLRTTQVSSDSTDESKIIDEASATVTYFGWAPAGTSINSPSWKILKMTVSGSVTTFYFADGAPDYTNIWANRASLSYS